MLEQNLTFCCPKKADSSQKSLLFPKLTLCIDIEQNVLVAASLYKMNLNTQSVLKQKLPKDQHLKKYTNQIISASEEINKKFFAKADYLVDKLLTCLRIELSKLQTLTLDGVETKDLFSNPA